MGKEETIFKGPYSLVLCTLWRDVQVRSSHDSNLVRDYNDVERGVRRLK